MKLNKGSSMNHLQRILLATLITLFSFVYLAGSAQAARIKDIAFFKGVRTNQLVGYGLIVGLNGSGDSDQTKFTVQSIVNMLERMGVHVSAKEVKVKNVATVMVTAQLPPFAKAGSKLDILVSSIGDAKSLQGGTLLLTPLKGVDSQIYALAQGPVSVGGFAVGGAAGGGVQKNHPTAGMIAAGATVEREIPYTLSSQKEIIIGLYRPDFTTVTRMSAAINKEVGMTIAEAIDADAVKVTVPESLSEDVVKLMARLELVEVRPDIAAKVVLNEKTGTVVMGENVKLSRVAIAHGNLSIQIKERKIVSQPLPLAKGETVVTPESEVAVKEEAEKLLLLEEGASIGEVVKALNAIGVTPRDLIIILQSLRAAGALQADLEII
ncbi:MAG: flagellar basal body P-ring protein FlgI [Deltaproteobacteria bacterium]|nr:flagellar basal body P-ring protein FlgI [Deltaproteobacteria bacterium]